MAKTKRGLLDGYNTYDTSKGFGNVDEWQDTFYQRMTGDEAKATLRDYPDDPHQILGISKSASKAEIKSAFRKLIMEWHPDKNPHRLEQAEAITKRIIAAYTILTS